jgi:DNA-directed RNA polymerase alpha subunit
MNTDKHLVWTGLPLRTVNALERAGITTVAQLAPLSRRELREIKGIGAKGTYEAGRLVGR